jgi:hypothetical protein
VTTTAGVSMTILGERKEGSHLTQNTQGPTYTQQQLVPAGTLAYVPLGDGAFLPPTSAVLLPHALLDVAKAGAFAVLKINVPDPAIVPMYYVVEY